MDQALIPSPFLDAASDQKLDVERPGNEARAFPEVHIQKGEGTIIIITINICQLQKLQHLDSCSLVPRLLVGETIINSLGTTRLGEAQGDKRSVRQANNLSVHYIFDTCRLHRVATCFDQILYNAPHLPI